MLLLFFHMSDIIYFLIFFIYYYFHYSLFFQSVVCFFILYFFFYIVKVDMTGQKKRVILCSILKLSKWPIHNSTRVFVQSTPYTLPSYYYFNHYLNKNNFMLSFLFFYSSIIRYNLCKKRSGRLYIFYFR